MDESRPPTPGLPRGAVPDHDRRTEAGKALRLVVDDVMQYGAARTFEPLRRAVFRYATALVDDGVSPEQVFASISVGTRALPPSLSGLALEWAHRAIYGRDN